MKELVQQWDGYVKWKLLVLDFSAEIHNIWLVFIASIFISSCDTPLREEGIRHACVGYFVELDITPETIPWEW